MAIEMGSEWCREALDKCISVCVMNLCICVEPMYFSSMIWLVMMFDCFVIDF